MALGYEVDRLKRITRGLGIGSTTDPAQTFEEGWDDIVGEIQAGISVNNNPAIPAPFRDTEWRFYHFSHNADNQLQFRFQLPHRWNRGEVRAHLHYLPAVDPSSSPQYAVWRCEYAWSRYGEVLPALAGWTRAEARSTISTGDSWKHGITELFRSTPDPATTKESSILCVVLWRLGSSAPDTPGWTDTYTTARTVPVGINGALNIGMISMDLHFQADKIGTTDEY